MAALAPMPSASEMIATMVMKGVRKSVRNAYRRFFIPPCSLSLQAEKHLVAPEDWRRPVGVVVSDDGPAFDAVAVSVGPAAQILNGRRLAIRRRPRGVAIGDEALGGSRRRRFAGRHKPRTRA